MRVFVVEFPGVYLGGLAVVVARDKRAARRRFNGRMKALVEAAEKNPNPTEHSRLRVPKAADAPMFEVNTHAAGVGFFYDGNY